MSCNLIQILPDESEIVQIRKELFLARCDVSYYKNLHQRTVSIRERLQYEHETAIRQLNKSHKQEVDQLKKTLERLK